MLYDALLLLGGLALLVTGGDLFVTAAIRIAEFLRMPRVVVGSTLVALTTTAPELVVSIMAGLKGESGLAVGNAVGSVICNIGLIFGITAMIKQVDVHIQALRKPLLVMFGAAVLLFVLTLHLKLMRWQGVLLLLGGAGFFIFDFASHWRDRKPADLAEAEAIQTGVTRTRFAWLQTPWGSITQFLAGAAIVVLGSRFLVDGAVSVASRMQIPSIIVGLTVVAVGTSLPELVTAITSSRKSVSDLAVGNVLGANIANLTLVVGTAAVMHEVSMDRQTQLFNFPAMLAVMIALVWTLWTDRRVTRREGVVLVMLYAGYIVALVGLTIALKR